MEGPRNGHRSVIENGQRVHIRHIAAAGPILRDRRTDQRETQRRRRLQSRYRIRSHW